MGLGLVAVLVASVSIGFSSCDAKFTSAPTAFISGGPAIPLTAFEVETIIRRAVESIDSENMHVAVTARTGDILGVYSTIVGGNQGNDDAANIAVGLARATSRFAVAAACFTGSAWASSCACCGAVVVPRARELERGCPSVEQREPSLCRRRDQPLGVCGGPPKQRGVAGARGVGGGGFCSLLATPASQRHLERRGI